MKIAVVDVDGVLADFRTPFKKLKLQKHEEDFFFSNPEYRFWYDLEPLIDAETFHQALKHYKVIFVTNCPHAKARQDWLIDYGFLVEGMAIACASQGTSKKDIVKMLRPEVFIDDYEKNIEEINSLGIVKHIFKFDQDKANYSWFIIKEELDKTFKEEIGLIYKYLKCEL